MPSLTALPQYKSAVAWSEFIPGVFTVGYSKLDGPDTLGIQYPQFPFNLPYDDISERLLSLTYTRGRSDDLTEVQATGGTMEIVDDDEVYNPHNVSSPIRETLHPLRPYRVRAVGPRLVPLTSNGWVIDDVTRARSVIGDSLEQALLRRKPLGYWRFNEPATGTLAYADEGGDSDMLAYPEGVAIADVATLISGDSGIGKQLANGTRLVVQSGDSVNPRAGMTLIALLKLDVLTPPFADRRIYHKPTQWELRVDTASHLSFSYYGMDGYLIDVRSTPAVVQGVRKFLVVSWDGKNVRMWIDGDEVETERGLLHAS